MAAKVEKPAPKGAPVDELEILHPERDIEVGGQKLVMREYGWTEGLKLRSRHKAFIDALHALLEQSREQLRFEDIVDLLAEHNESVVAMVAQAADVDAEFMDTLKDDEGEALLMLWWIVNGPFFLRRVLGRIRQELIRAALLAKVPAGDASTPPSSATATATPTSAATPSGS